MKFGIKYFCNGGSVVFDGKCNMLFTNPFVAYKVSKYLNKKNNTFDYNVYKLSKDEESQKKDLPVLKSFEDYKQYSKDITDNALKVASEPDNALEN